MTIPPSTVLPGLVMSTYGSGTSLPSSLQSKGNVLLAGHTTPHSGSCSSVGNPPHAFPGHTLRQEREKEDGGAWFHSLVRVLVLDRPSQDPGLSHDCLVGLGHPDFTGLLWEHHACYPKLVQEVASWPSLPLT